MLFTSIYFGLFFLVVFLVYWLFFNKKTTWQNIVLLVAGYYFYGSWDYRFLYLLVGVSVFNYLMGLLIGRTGRKAYRRWWLILGIIADAGTLVVFKYYDFFQLELKTLLSSWNIPYTVHSLKLFVPLGISFYIFLSISYLVDIYRKHLEPEKNPLNTLLTFGFFPIVLAGPIHRPVSLLPQIRNMRIFDRELATDGLRQFLWGLAVKMIIADNCAVYVDKVFANEGYEGSTLFYGALFFTIQIYADFSSYSDMAIGMSKMLGFRLMRNFNYPYFARDIADFWRRWHISLTSWFRDYIFLPIAYLLSKKIKRERMLYVPSDLIIYSLSLLFTWMLTGLWHGANTTFIIWGLIHAVLLVIHHALKKPRKWILSRYNMHHDVLYVSLQRIYTLFFVVVSWVFFRVQELPQAVSYLERTFKLSLFSPPKDFPTSMIIPLFIFFLTEWLQQDRQHGLDFTGAPKTKFLRWSVYLGIILFMFFYQVKQQNFIYFKF